MSVLRVIGYAIFGFFLLMMLIFAVSLVIVTMQMPHVPLTHTPVRVSMQAAGITYEGPPTQALTGYYCVYNASIASDGWIVNGTMYEPNQTAYSPPGYSIQLNVGLPSGVELQDVWGGSYTALNGQVIAIPTQGEVWVNGTLIAMRDGPPALNCGWLVIKIENGTAYFGFSSTGEDIDWFMTYPVGNTTIQPGVNTGIVIAGPGGFAGVNFTSLYAVLALYYWNGTAWVPAPVVPGSTHTGEFVVNAWVYVSDNEGVVTWPGPMNETVSLPTPGFKP